MAQPSTPTPHDDDARYRAVLDTLIEQGAAIAARLAGHATAATTPDSALPEATVAFDRIARAIRRTVALARHIAAHQAPGPAHVSAPGTNRTTTRAQLIRGVEDAIHRQRRELDTEPLYAELGERLDDPELDLDLQGRPVDDIIEEICRDLGVAQQGRSYVWRRRTPQDIATLRHRAATPTVGRISEAPSAKQPTPPKAPIPNHPPPDLAAMLALCVQPASDG